ncbi:MAG: UvrD-helicase domain-containing protein [Leptospiraceae bacterium]|nr:UvrD-helicase domain-containing protein [Leptospiraceae bacterium]MCP5497130.1 UvrD-helicase domain-containing protein [Leptospiraceae bacterium]
MQLNQEQLTAVRHVNGPLLIFAGAGSGKTRVITNRIVHLIQKEGISAGKIVALTFTNKSAKEMQTRVKKMITKPLLRGIEISTFHSLGLKILKKHPEEIGLKFPFVLQTPYDQESIINDLLKSKKIDPQSYPSKAILSHFSRIKNTGEEYIAKLSVSPIEIDLISLQLFENYCHVLKELNSVDFDDLILLPTNLLTNNKQVRQYYQTKFKYIMVDEFQDTNQSQYTFLKLLMGNNPNLCVVGDDDQSIYGFRGSNMNLILNFEKDFPGAKVVHLLNNYRSTSFIVNAASSVIKNNPGRREKRLYSNINHGDKVKYIERENEKEEAIYVVDTLQAEMIKGKKPGGKIAILFRTNYQSRSFEEELRIRSIPYKLVGGYNFFDRKEVRDIISYIKIIANPKDEVSLLRVLNYPKRGIGGTTISKLIQKSIECECSVMEILERLCEKPEFVDGIKKKTVSAIYEFLEIIHKYKKEFFKSHQMSSVLNSFIKEIGFEKEIVSEESDEKVIKARMNNLSEVVNMLSYFENELEQENKPNLFDFIIRLTLLMEDIDPKLEQEDKKVQLMTMHLSKGLEFDIVFLVGLEEGIIPNSRVLEEGSGVDEERRLFYVGMTRAKEKLILTGAKERKKYGETVLSNPSRFIEEISCQYLDTYKIENESSESSNIFLNELEKLKSA